MCSTTASTIKPEQVTTCHCPLTLNVRSISPTRVECALERVFFHVPKFSMTVCIYEVFGTVCDFGSLGDAELKPADMDALKNIAS